jgi:regulator of sigma E protease
MEILGFVFSVLVGLFLLVLLVALHELGHGIVARRNGVVVEEFGIGFPPKAWGKRLKGSILGKNVLFTLNWLPLGGFVKLQGEHDAANNPGDYGAAPLWAKTKILLAGVAINWISAVLLFTVLALTGLPKVIDNQFTVAADTTEVRKPVTVVQVSEGSPAAQAGLKKGDELVRFAGQRLDEPADLTNLTKRYHGQSVEVIYNRGGSESIVHVELRKTNTDGKGYLGVGANQRTTYRSTWSAPIVGVALSGQLTGVTLQGLGDMVVKFGTGLADKVIPGSGSEGDQKLREVSEGVAGPVAILGILFPSATETGLGSLLFMTALISLALAVMNILPIPALDGGRWFVTMLFRVLRKPLTQELEEKIHGTGFMVLMVLFVLVTIADIGKFGH